MFRDSETQESSGPVLKNRSKFNPLCPNPSIQTFCRMVEGEILENYKDKTHYSNISPNEKLAIQELSEDTSIIIKPADKGGAIVVQNMSDYKREAYRQLDDEEFYRRLSTNPTKDFQRRIQDISDNALRMHWISKKEHSFLNCQHPVTPVFYMLPKIHKSLVNPKGRPIVASNESLLEPLSNFVDYFIKPYVLKLPSYVKDSTDIINKISEIKDLPVDTLLVTLDVESLYTNISHDRGLDALGFYLQDRTDLPPSHFIVELASMVLKLNYFSFIGEFYLQLKGTSMGSTFAPDYANLYVGFFEQKYVFNREMNPFSQKILKWYRFLDDVFCLFQGTSEELCAFGAYLNSCNSDLKFTLEYDQSCVSFLDMWIKQENGSLITTLYKKETDRNTFLLATSAHPRALKNGLPKSQFYRLRRLCHSDNDYIEKAAEMKQRFLERGYPAQCVDVAYHTALSKPRADLLKKSVKKDQKFSVSCITTYTPQAHIIKKTVKKHWHILTTDPALSDLFQDPPLFVHKRGPNLRNKLIRANILPPPKQTLLTPIKEGNYPCGNCAHCHNSVKTNTFKHPRTGKRFGIRGIITCNTKNVIYMLTCPCEKIYIGKTTRPLKQRISEHKSSIRRNDENYPVACHFNNLSHPLSSLRFQGIEQVTLHRGGDVDRKLCQRELFWIHKLDALQPSGLNEDFDMSVFI